MKLRDAYLSVHEALKHAGVHQGCAVRVRWVDAENMSYEEAARLLDEVDGVLVPGGFGSRGWEGKILACRIARERRIPYLGICLGMHVAVSEFARHVCGLDGGELDGDGSRDSASGHRPAARAEGDRGPRRHDAAGRAGGRGGRGDAHARCLRRGRHPRAPPASLRGEQPLSPDPRRARPRRLRDVPGGSPRRDRRAARPPVVRREPVPPRVQVAPDAARAALPRVHRRRARAKRRAVAMSPPRRRIEIVAPARRLRRTQDVRASGSTPLAIRLSLGHVLRGRVRA